MNEVIKSLLTRRSIREFTAKPVDKTLLDTIVQCGLYSASARNLQPWHFVVITDKACIDELVKGYVDMTVAEGGPFTERVKAPGFHNFHHAPAVILICGSVEAKFAVSDCGGAAQNMSVAAHALGLGSCIVANVLQVFSGPKNAYLRQLLHVPEGYNPLLTLAIGHMGGVMPEAAERKANAVTLIP